MRKKILPFFLIAVFSFSLLSCNDTEDQLTEISLSIQPDALPDYDGQGGIKTIFVKTMPEDLQWVVTAEESWYAILPDTVGHKSFTAKVDPFFERKERSEVITISAPGAKSVTMEIRQKGGNVDPYLRLDKNSISFANVVSREKIVVISNTNDWVVTGGDEEWLTVEVNERNFTVQVDANQEITGTPRTAVLTVGSKHTPSQTLTISQEARTLSASPTKFEIDPEKADSLFFLVSSNTQWEVDSDVEWITIHSRTKRGEGNDTLFFSVDKFVYDRSINTPRTGIISLSADGPDDVRVQVIQDYLPENYKVSYNELLGYYNVTGTKLGYIPEGIDAWDCYIYRGDEQMNPPFMISTNYGGRGETYKFNIDFINNIPTLDFESITVRDGNLIGVLSPGYYDTEEDVFVRFPIGTKIPELQKGKWDFDTQSITFSATYDGYPVGFGILAYDQDGEIVSSAFTDLYTDVVFVQPYSGKDPIPEPEDPEEPVYPDEELLRAGRGSAKLSPRYIPTVVKPYDPSRVVKAKR